MLAKRQNRIISDTVKTLVHKLTGFEETDENFTICEQFALSNIKYHRFLSVDSHAVKRQIKGLIEKFRIHGHCEAAEKLKLLVEAFLTETIFTENQHQQYDIEWSLLRLLINLAYNPTAALNGKFFETSSLPVTSGGNTSTTTENWQLILKQDLNLRTDYDTHSESSWDSDDIGSENEDQVQETKLVRLAPSVSGNSGLSWGPRPTEVSSKVPPEQWLHDNVQPLWWKDGASCKTQSDLKDANLAVEWQSYVTKLSYGLLPPPETCLISEYCALREVLWLLQVPSAGECKLFKREGDMFYAKTGVTLPSLIPTTFNAMMKSFCPYLSILYQIESFGKDLKKSNTFREQSMCTFTYEAYNEALMTMLRPFRLFLVDLEEEVKKQDAIFTLLTLQNVLKPHFSFLSALHSVHTCCVTNWRSSPAWVSASSLLTSLYSGSFTMGGEQAPIISFLFFLKSVKVYLSIIQVWLNEGRLEDLHEEFVIQKRLDSNSETGFCFRDTSGHKVNKSGPLFEVLVHKVLNSGQSIHILQSLDRLRELQKQQTTMENLYDLFIKSILSEVSKYETKTRTELDSTTSRTDQLVPFLSLTSTTSVNQTDDAKTKSVNMSLKPQVMDSLLTTLFVNATKDSARQPTLSQNNSNDVNFDLMDLYDRLRTSPPVPFKVLMNKVFKNILNSNCMQACKMVSEMLKNEFHLMTHLKALQNVLLVQASDPMCNFYSQLFTEIENGQPWNNAFYLTTQLETFLSSQFPDFALLFSVSLSGPGLSGGCLGALDILNLDYRPGFPLSLVITQDSVRKYNEAMRFLLKVKWGLWALQNLRFTELLRGKGHNKQSVMLNAKRLHVLRFWLLHAVGSIHSYLMVQVLVVSKQYLESAIEDAVVLEDLIEAHMNFLHNLRAHCMLVSKHQAIHTAILQLLNLVQLLRLEWQHCFEDADCVDGFDGEHISGMENTYMKCHKLLADCFRNSLDYDGNQPLRELEAVFNRA